MTYASMAPDDLTAFAGARAARTVSAQTLCGCTALAVSLLVCAVTLPQVGSAPMASMPAAPFSATAPRPAAVPGYGALLDPASLGFAPVSLARSSPLVASLVPPTSAVPVEVATAPAMQPAAIVAMEDAPPAMPDPVPVAASTADIPLPATDIPAVVASVPLPIPRPSAPASPVQAPAARGPVRAGGRQIAQNRPVAAPADHRSFFEKVFGMLQQPQPPGPVLAYAAPEDSVFANARRLTSGPVTAPDRWTAVYDISAHTVTLPDGTRLEAHSGLGGLLDDPRHVDEPNRGATPPHIYDLEPRAQLFHGVQALRLNPVGGGGMFGRNGLLAHTYMLGPNGDSNGCVSFRNYNAFLQAYANGAVRRLLVVARS